MRKTAFLLLLVSLLVVALSVPAGAGIENNPTVIEATELSCANGFSGDTLLIVGRTGHTPDGLAGIATSVHVLTGPGGDVVLTAFDVPGQGLDNITVWCEWFEEGTWFGGHVILTPSLR